MGAAGVANALETRKVARADIAQLAKNGGTAPGGSAPPAGNHSMLVAPGQAAPTPGQKLKALAYALVAALLKQINPSLTDEKLVDAITFYFALGWDQKADQVFRVDETRQELAFNGFPESAIDKIIGGL